ncbi:MAG: HAD-IC family P-type ATPase, partial [Microcystaceae cyanobacterium]
SERKHTPKAKMEGLYRRAIQQSFIKLDPRIAVKNPVMFMVWVGTMITAITTLNPDIFGDIPGDHQRLLNETITVILLFTLLFANFAEAIAEGRGKAQADALRSTKTDTMARKQLPDGSIARVNSTTLKRGDQIQVIAGDIIPADGEVIGGMASVDESAITGESAPVLKQPGTDIASSVTGGTRIISDQLIIRVTADPGKGFIDRMIALVEGAERSKTPNEIALTVLLAVLSEVFLIVIMTLPPFANYIQNPVSVAVLIALLVALIPTTIGGLLSAIGIAGMDRVAQFNVIATSGRAVEACGDVNTLILDKTGTITLGNRLAEEFIPVNGHSVDEVAQIA